MGLLLTLVINSYPNISNICLNNCWLVLFIIRNNIRNKNPIHRWFQMILCSLWKWFQTKRFLLLKIIFRFNGFQSIEIYFWFNKFELWRNACSPDPRPFVQIWRKNEFLFVISNDLKLIIWSHLLKGFLMTRVYSF